MFYLYYYFLYSKPIFYKIPWAEVPVENSQQNYHPEIAKYSFMIAFNFCKNFF